MSQSPMDSQEEDDFRDLLAQIRGGSDDAAKELVQRYGERVRRAVRRSLNRRLRSQFDSLDFVQLVWSSLFRVRNELERFDQPEELAAFLAQMARNKVGMEVRRRLSGEKHNVNRERPIDEEASGGQAEVVDREPTPVEMAIAHERWEQLLENQPQRRQQILKLRALGYSRQEIADKLGIAPCTVRRVIQKLESKTG